MQGSAGTPLLILASSSPQRTRLLDQARVAHRVMPVDCPEDLDRDEDAEVMVERLCREKMAAALAQLPEDLTAAHPVLTADTLVSLDHHRLGKPRDREEAGRFLDLLGGRTHQVYTGVCLYRPGSGTPEYTHSTSDVTFRPLGSRDREWYLDTGEWQGAAGGYRIQGAGACLVDRIEGSYTGIVGLPLELVYRLLRP